MPENGSPSTPRGIPFASDVTRVVRPGEATIITPEMAKAWLGRNVDNRPVKRSLVARLIADIEEGHWYVGDSCICFDRDGNLVNGQHRLRACVESDAPITAIIMVECDRGNTRAMDRGIVRTSHESMHMAGVTVSKRVATMIPGIMSTVLGGRGRQMTISQMEEFLLTHKRNLLLAGDITEPLISKRGIGRIAIPIAIFRALHHESEQDLRRFVEVLGGDPQNAPHENAATLLANYLYAQNRGSDDQMMHRTCGSAIRHFCRRNVIKLLRAANTEPYPVDGLDIVRRQSSARSS